MANQHANMRALQMVQIASCRPQELTLQMCATVEAADIAYQAAKCLVHCLPCLQSQLIYKQFYQ